MKTKELIRFLETMQPELPVVVRIDVVPPDVRNIGTIDTPVPPLSRLCTPQTIHYCPLDAGSVVDTWNGETGMTSVELSVRI
jgi:hypothetical protein